MGLRPTGDSCCKKVFVTGASWRPFHTVVTGPKGAACLLPMSPNDKDSVLLCPHQNCFLARATLSSTCMFILGPSSYPALPKILLSPPTSCKEKLTTLGPPTFLSLTQAPHRRTVCTRMHTHTHTHTHNLCKARGLDELTRK